MMSLRHLLLATAIAFSGALSVPVYAQASVRISPIAELRSWLGPAEQPVRLRGVLTRLGDDSFIQDFSAGVMVHFDEQPRMRLGDEIEVRGLPEQRTYGTILQHATAHVLWAGAPLPPVSVNVSQVARGDFDNQFIEVEAALESVEKRADTTLLHVSEDSQQFVAILE